MSTVEKVAGALGKGLAAAVWGSAQVTLPALAIAPPAVFSPKAEVAIDTLHHTVTQ